MSERDYILDPVTRKVVEVLLENPDVPYNKSSLAEEAGVSRDALYRRWDTLMDMGIVEEVTMGSEASYYSLHGESEAVEAIQKLLSFSNRA
ncbi:MAG: winged helix-turn-helix domain-containing protein [Candidatus Nanohaloarchaea archaeon]|nr:winged helix-turn-helix domain-containing protein [Candidatus Nanohaloarchaea archaeon]